MSNWLAISLQVIDQTTKAMPPDCTVDELRKALSKAYPFYERKMWPYKVWCKAVKKALARKEGRRLPENTGPMFQEARQ